MVVQIVYITGRICFCVDIHIVHSEHAGTMNCHRSGIGGSVQQGNILLIFIFCSDHHANFEA